MATEIAYNVSIGTDSAGQSLNSLRSEFKTLQKELNGLDVSSKEYIETLKKLGAVKDDIGDLNTTIKALNPEGKVEALGSAIGGVASGFQAATAATALFGSENEELNRQLLRVQAAMAFTDGIKGLVGLGDAFNVLKVVVMSNPLFIIGGVVTAIVVALYKMKDSIPFVADAFKKVGEVVDTVVQGLKDFGDWIGITNFKAEEMKKKTLDLNKQIEQSNKNIAKSREESEKYRDQIEKANHDAWLKRQDEKKKKEQEAAAEKKRLEKEKADAEIAENKRIHDEAQSDALFVEAFLQETQKNEDTLNEKKKADKEAAKQKEIQDAKDLTELQKREQQQRYALAANTLNSIQSVTDLAFQLRMNKVKKGSEEEKKVAKQMFNVNKGLQIAQATMQGIQAVQAAFSSGLAVPIIGPATGAVFAGIAAIGAAANVAKIASAKFDDGGSGGGDVSAPSATLPNVPTATNAPTVNAPSNSTTQLNSDGTIREPSDSKSMVVKAVVVETDITSSQKSVNKIKESATY